jgi:RNA-directed DNA polymerase
MAGRSSPTTVSTRLQQIAELARQAPEMVLTTLAHHIDVELLREAYRLTRKSGAVGVDGQTAAAYAEDLEENLEALLDRFKSGTYKAPPVRRLHIPKGDGTKTRPIGIPTFEDKVLQRAAVMVLESIYEQDFRDCSYGFRPGRSAHQALEVLWTGLMNMGGGWVLDVDIQSFFDTLDHGCLRRFLDQRVRDGGSARRRKRKVSRCRYSPGWGGVASSCKHLPSLCTGRVVRRGGQAETSGPSPPHQVC